MKYIVTILLILNAALLVTGIVLVANYKHALNNDVVGFQIDNHNGSISAWTANGKNGGSWQVFGNGCSIQQGNDFYTTPSGTTNFDVNNPGVTMIGNPFL